MSKNGQELGAASFVKDILPTQMIISTERLVLRPPVLEDVPALMSMLNDWQVAQWLSLPPYPYTAEDGQAFCALCAENHARLTPTLFGVAAGATLIGSVELTPSPDRVWGVGYWLGRGHWGQGYAQETLVAISAYARHSLASARLIATIDPENEPSLKLLTRAGFTFEKLLSRGSPTRRGCSELHQYSSSF